MVDAPWAQYILKLVGSKEIALGSSTCGQDTIGAGELPSRFERRSRLLFPVL